MNWKEIDEKYSEAKSLYDDWLVNNYHLIRETSVPKSGILQYRELYDFFDEQGIFINIELSLLYLEAK